MAAHYILRNTAQQFGDDGARIYTRARLKGKSPEKLLVQVSACVPRLQAYKFRQDERDNAADLNQNLGRFE